jgi:hypothetical protein
MELAALLIAVGALVLATASVTLQITLFIQSKKQSPAPQQFVIEDESFLTPSAVEMQPRENTKAKQVIKEAQDRRLQDAFDNPDVPYTGIDEEFNV